jgi:hypothetical protein
MVSVYMSTIAINRAQRSSCIASLVIGYDMMRMQTTEGEGRGPRGHGDLKYRTSLSKRAIFSETHRCADIPGALIAQGDWGNRQNGIAEESVFRNMLLL